MSTNPIQSFKSKLLNLYIHLYKVITVSIMLKLIMNGSNATIARCGKTLMQQQQTFTQDIVYNLLIYELT